MRRLRNMPSASCDSRMASLFPTRKRDRMRKILLATLLCVAASTAEAAPPRQLTLREAVDLAFKSDPTLSEAHIQRDRSHWQYLRAELDRFSLKVDGSVQELFNKSNI